MDVTIVNVALPAIRRDLRATTAGLQWVIDAYTLVLASLLMLSGSVGDRFGRRRVFQIGLVLFTGASALCSAAPTLGVLVAFRMLQAVGASMLNPVAMSIITNVFVEPKARARAIGTWGAVVGVSMGLGPLIGGALTQGIGWRAIFWVNLPIGVAALVLARLFVPESRAPHARRADPVGQGLMLGGLAALTTAIIEGPRLGWGSPLIVGLFAGAAALGGALLAYEPRRAEPLVDLRFFRSVPFSCATLVAVLAFSVFSGFLFLNALYLQEVRGLPAFVTGLYTLPLALATVVCSPLSGWLIGRSGARAPLVLAGLGVAASALLLAGLDARTPLARVVAAYVVFGVGFGLVNAPITNTAVSGMPRARAGLAAAIASTSRQVGASLGVAVGGTIAQARHDAGGGLVGAMHAFFILAAAAGGCIVALGMLSTSTWGRQTLRRTAALIEEGDRPAPGGAS
ncbi:MAG TPA: MFS transporter [Polyangia bacterium]|nr:MFS transporter [Polyangia bacterium]